MKALRIVIGILILAVLALLGFVYSGAYPIGADVPHTGLVYKLLDTLRERSVGVRAVDIRVPELGSKAMILAGAGAYDEMCAQCHMRPGQTESELSTGLYPKPPNLTVPDRDEADGDEDTVGPAQEFWIIKHGIKASAMPAWGLTHDDQRIWSMVAFLQKLPALSREQYDAMISDARLEAAEHDAERHRRPMQQEPAAAQGANPQAESDGHGESG